MNYWRRTISVFEKIKRIVAKEFDVNATEILPKSSFADDLGVDSLGYVILLQALEEEFNMEFPDEETMNLRTVEDAVKYIESKIQK
jgi:acyl carrier protein